MKLPAYLPIVALAFFTTSALACWSCDGTTDADCRARIEQSRLKTAEQIAMNNADACEGKEAGVQPMHFGLSTAGSFAHVCDGNGSGCLHWISDDMGQPRNRFYPLGGTGSCDLEQTLQAEKNNGSTVAKDLGPSDYEYRDEKGNRVVLLDENVAQARKRNREPAGEEVGSPLFPLGALEKVAP